VSEIAVALDLGGTDIKGALVNREGKIHAAVQEPTGEDLRPEAVIGRLAAVAENLRRQAPADSAVIGIGVGGPGGIYPEDRRVSQSPNFPGWHDVDLAGPLAQRAGLPVALDNDANVAAYGEFHCGVGRDVDSMVLLTLGTGIGGGVILEGKIWRGTWGMAGEVGHVIVEPNGHPCGCGGWGCVEQYAAGPAMVRLAREAWAAGEIPRSPDHPDLDPEQLTPALLYRAAKAGCPVSRKVFETSATYLGILITGLLNVLNVPLFALGGGVSASFDLLYPTAREVVRRRAYRIPGENVRLERALLGNEAGVIGAGMLVFHERSV